MRPSRSGKKTMWYYMKLKNIKYLQKCIDAGHNQYFANTK